jgi:hypothetical protein
VEFNTFEPGGKNFMNDRKRSWWAIMMSLRMLRGRIFVDLL